MYCQKESSADDVDESEEDEEDEEEDEYAFLYDGLGGRYTLLLY